MALTPNEWREMWDAIKWLESRVLFAHPKTRAFVTRIKELIQREIGKME